MNLICADAERLKAYKSLFELLWKYNYSFYKYDYKRLDGGYGHTYTMDCVEGLYLL
jgi:hypothetical protein